MAALNGTKKRKDGLKEDLVKPRVRHEEISCNVRLLTGGSADPRELI